MLAEPEKRFIRRYPNARDVTESIAIAASPLSIDLLPVLRRSTAAIIVTGITEEELNKRVEDIRRVSQKYEHVCFAIGQCYDDNRSNVRQVLRIADERMYEDKRQFYEKHPELKR